MMITLSDISLKSFITDGLKSRINEEAKLAKVLIANDVKNYQALADYIESGHPDFQNEIFRRMLAYACKNLATLPTAKSIPPIYHFNSYDSFPKIKELFCKTDSEVNCADLPIFSPLEVGRRPLKQNLRKYSISDAKEYLSMYSNDLKNAFVSQNLHMTQTKLEDIVKGIRFYEDHLIHTAQNLEGEEFIHDNLFTINRDKKRALVEQNFDEILNYLLSISETFIWGSFKTKRRKHLESCITPQTDLQIQTRNNLITLISNYVTLKELQDGIIENETLKKFIIEPISK